MLGLLRPSLKLTAIIALAYDEAGRIFAETYERVPGREGWVYFDVFDSEGKYMTKVPIKRSGNLPLLWKNECLYQVEQDKEGYQKIKRYKVNWKISKTEQ